MKPGWPEWLKFRRDEASAESLAEKAETEMPQVSVLLQARELYVRAFVILALVVSVVVSALLIIYTAYHYRQHFNHQQQLVQQWDELQVEWGQLLLEQGALAASSRVESLATKRLNMQMPVSIEVIRDER